MSRSINTIVISGRLGSDPERRESQGGEPYTRFSLALDMGTKDKPRVIWPTCMAFGQTAENVAQHCRKGDSVAVTGRLDCSFYEKDGVQHSQWQVMANQVTFLAMSRSRSNQGGGS